MATQYAVVTGTSSGIGLQIIESLIERDFFVFGGSRTESSFSHPNFLDIELDVTDEQSFSSFFDRISEYTQDIDLVINNAGIGELGPICDLEEQDFINQIDTNLVSQFYFFKNLQDFIINDKTHIINILSTSAKYSYPNTSAYCAAEQGKLGFINSIQKEWENFNIKFSNIFIGAVDTAFWHGIRNKLDRSKMLTIDEFMYVFDTIVDAPEVIQFPDVTFLHKESYL